MQILRRFIPVLSRIVVVVVVGVVLALATAAFANHLYSDVPTLANYHESVSWLSARAVTLGCSSGLYCPNDVVTRASMALFMNRLGKVLSLRYLEVANFLGGTDIDVSPVFCQTADYTPTYPQRVKADVWLAFVGPGNIGFGIAPVFSTNGGTTWTRLPASVVSLSRAHSITSEWGFGADTATMDLIAGTPYRFAVQTLRVGLTTADPTDGRCRTVVQITNRNPDGENPETILQRPTRSRIDR